MAIQKVSIKGFFQDRNGKTVIWQNLNPPIILWAVTTVASKLIKHSTLHSLLEIVAFGAVFTWAWLEIFQGASPFRRVLGFVVIVFSASAAAFKAI